MVDLKLRDRGGGVQLKVLVGVCARQHPEIFRAFLLSLFGLDTEDMEVQYFFIFHNWEAGKSILAEYSQRPANVSVMSYRSQNRYLTDADTHHWTPDLVREVTHMRNAILQQGLKQEADAVFMVDSDLLLRPYTLRQLSVSGKDVIAEVFWTRWRPDGPELPNAWDFNEYEHAPGSLRLWRRPGEYRVGGAGACTLIRTSAIRQGLSYSPVWSVNWFGEDRALQLRAAVLGIPIFLDTHCPAYHIYRLEELPKGRAWYASLQTGEVAP